MCILYTVYFTFGNLYEVSHSHVTNLLQIPMLNILVFPRFGEFSEKLSSFPGLQSERRNSDGTPWCSGS